jgi:hypothetical protein
MIPVNPSRIELDPIEIDPRPCEFCGLTIDQHRMVDTGEGPEFFCEEFETPDAANLVRQWELADPRDAWKWTGEQPPKNCQDDGQFSRPYSTPEATIRVFWFVVSLNDLEYLKAWLAKHPADAPTLLELLESK